MPEVQTRRQRISALGGARVGEQLALAVSLLVLARRLGVSEFGAVSLVYAYQSLAVTASDYGLGLTLLRTAPGQTVERRALQRCRAGNGAVLALAAAVALVLGASERGQIALLVFVGAVLWAASAEAFIRKSAALRLGMARRVALSELLGSLILLTIVLVAARGERAVVVVAVAFAVKSIIEVAAHPSAVRRSFGSNGARLTHGWVWTSQLLSFVTANVDYAVVQLLLGSRALGLYSLAFRVTAFVPSQISSVVMRVSTVDLARLSPDQHRQAARRLVRLLFAVGTTIAVIGSVGAPLVGTVLGSRWDDAAPIIVILLVAVPWRIVLSVAGISALVRDEVKALTRFEVGRLTLVVTSLVLGAQLGLVGCAAFGAGAVVLASLWAHVGATFRPWSAAPRWLVPAGVASLALLAALAISLR